MSVPTTVNECRKMWELSMNSTSPDSTTICSGKAVASIDNVMSPSRRSFPTRGGGIAARTPRLHRHAQHEQPTEDADHCVHPVDA
jgi:hypothetical protein